MPHHIHATHTTRSPARPRRPRPRRGVAIAAVCVAIVIVNAALIQAVIAPADDHASTAWRAQSARAFFAAESGVAIAAALLSRDIPLESDTIELQPGISLTIEHDPHDDHSDIVLTGASGIATRQIRVHLE